MFCTKYLTLAKLHSRFTLQQAKKAQRSSRCTALLFLKSWRCTRAGRQRHAPTALPREGPSILCIAGRVGSRAGLDGCGKSHPLPGFDPRSVQHVSSRYTDWAIQSVGYVMQRNSSQKIWLSSTVVSLYENSGTINLIRPRPLPFTHFVIHCPLHILVHDVLSRSLTGS
jgi:hypothetical protein